MTEYLDVYDANKKHIGTADRTVVHTFGLWHKTVHCWIMWRGKIVFQRRGRNTGDVNAGKLYTTASGHVSAGDTVESAFFREVAEEIGIQPAHPQKLYEIAWVGNYQKKNGDWVYDRVFANEFFAEYDGELSDLKFTDGEVDSVVAIDLDAVLKFIHGNGLGTVNGIEFDGKKSNDVVLTIDDFVLNAGENIQTKYGSNFERIKRELNV